jgi:calcineurin-like phosphoesterase family protein
MVIHKDMLLTVGHNRPGIKLEPKGVVIHYTANPQKGANAIANRNYFQSTTTQASAHYIVDDKNIVRCIPEEEVAWHCGGTTLTEFAKKEFGGKQNNYLIGIEMCVNSDGDWEKTYKNTVLLVVDILKRYKWDTSKILRHHDLTGKDCPRMMTKFVVGGEEYFQRFKKDVQGVLNGGIEILENWQLELGRNAIDKLASKNIITNPEQWKQDDMLEKPVPSWLFWEVIARTL